MEDFKKALEGTLGRKHIDNIVDQVASSDRKSTRLNSSHDRQSRMPSSA